MMLHQTSSFADENAPATTSHGGKSLGGAKTPAAMKKTAFTPSTKHATANGKRRAFGDISNRKGSAPNTMDAKSVSFQQQNSKSIVKSKSAKKSAKKAAVKTPFAIKKSSILPEVEMLATRPFDPFFGEDDEIDSSDKENWMLPNMNQLTLMDSSKKHNRKRTHRRRNRAETLVNLDEFLALAAATEMDDVSLMVAPDDLYSLPSSRIDLSVMDDADDLQLDSLSICDISF